MLVRNLKKAENLFKQKTSNNVTLCKIQPMKKIVTILALSATSLLVKAQSLQLLQLSDSTPVANSYTVNLNANDPQYVFEAIVKNISANSVSTKVRKTVISTTAGQDMLFCYGSTCYTPATIVSTNAVNIPAGQQMPNGTGTYGIRTEFNNNGIIGSSTVRYMAYNTADANDTAVFYITYIVSAVGVETFNNNVKALNAFPNPVGNSLAVSYNINRNSVGAEVKIFNIAGSLVKTIPVNPSETSVRFDVSDLQDGVYFYTICINGSNTSTKKLVVNHDN